MLRAALIARATTAAPRPVTSAPTRDFSKYMSKTAAKYKQRATARTI